MIQRDVFAPNSEERAIVLTVKSSTNPPSWARILLFYLFSTLLIAVLAAIFLKGPW